MATDSRLIKINTRSLQFKLVLSYIFVIFASFIIIGYLLDKNLEEQSLGEIKASLSNQANLVESRIPLENLKSGDTPFLHTLVQDLSKKINSRITIIDKSGKVLADSEITNISKMDNHLDRPEVKSALSKDIGEEIRYSSTLKIDMLYTAIPIKDDKGAAGVVRLALPLTYVKGQLSAIRKAVAASVFFALGLALVLGSVFARSVVKPINRIVHGARRFSGGDFTYRIMLDSKDEIGELAFTLNNMAKAIEDKIRELGVQNQHLGAILQSMVEGIIVVDKANRIISVNKSGEEIFNIRKEDVENKLFLEAIPNNDISDLINGVLERSRFISKELSLVWPVQKIFRIDAVPIFERDTIAGCLLVIHDITEMRRLEAMRRDFVANVSHELKTPLTSIKGFVETLLEGAIDDKANATHFLKIIEDHTSRLDDLVNDLLSLSYLESKEASLKREKINTKTLSDDILAGFKSQLNKKSVEAKNDLPPALLVTADKDRLGQVMTNLIDNAIKFNKENGKIRIYSEKDKNGIKIIVEDTGLGIPRKDIPRIFERFYRVDKTRSREMGGTGLGLSIVKHIIELHGGAVGVESSDGAGSKFFFTLPH